MKESRNFELFPPEYRNLIQQYIENLQKIFQEYKVVIFMARKAICFYKSLIIGGFIEKPQNCEVFSSRILTYDIFNKLKGKKIILVDDIIKEGKSISDALEILSDNNLKAHIYIMARRKINKNEDLLRNENIIETFIEMVEEDRLQLSKYIADFIEANMCPYNIDQPIYRLLFSDDKIVADFIKKHNLINTSNEQKRKHGIESYVLEIPNEYFKDPSLKDNVELCKIRFLHMKYHNKNVFLAIPFVLFSEMENKNLETAFSRYNNEQIRQFINNKNDIIIRENKLKIIHFVSSSKMMDAFIHMNENNDTQWKRLDSNDAYVFSRDILHIINKVEDIFAFSDTDFMNDSNFVCEFKQNEYLSLTYDFIYSNEKRNNDYCNSDGEVIPSDKLLILLNLKRYIISKINGEFNNLLFSNVIDVLIDKGLIIPSVVHHRLNPTIIRAYKYGEIYSLNEKHFKLFTYALCEYLNEIGKDRLRKTEFEKLCVLFFKEAENGVLDYSKASGNEDEFSICYSKFGPRVSTSKPIYSADEDSTLASKLITLKLIELKSIDAEKVYTIPKIAKEVIENQSWLIKAQIFSTRYALLYKDLFEGSGEEILFDEVRNMHMRTYLEFLIMLSIGLNKKNQLLSLLAEIYLIDTTEITMKNIEQTLKDYRRILDGLISGMWKYMCYAQKEHPLQKVYNKLRSNHKTKQLSLSISIGDIFNLNPDVDKNTLIEPMIEEAGKLIFSFVYSIWFMFEKHGIKYYEHKKDVDLKKTKKREFFYDKLEPLRKSVEEQIKSNNNEQDLKTLQNLKSDAKKILDRYSSEIARGRKHEKEDSEGSNDMGNNRQEIRIIKPRGSITVQVSGRDSIQENNFDSISNELIEKLNQVLLRSEENDKEALNNAITAVKNKDEKGFISAIKKVGTVTLSIVESVFGNVIHEYLRQRGVF